MNIEQVYFLDLDPNFSPFSYVKKAYSNRFIEFENFTFKGGEPHIKLKIKDGQQFFITDHIMITHRIHTYEDLGLLKVAVNALDGLTKARISLFLPYFPGARQDRRMVKGEPFTSAVYVKELHSMNFAQIVSFDMHSDVVAGMFEVLGGTVFVDSPNYNFIYHILDEEAPFRGRDWDSYYIISPDAGSNKKIYGLLKDIGETFSLIKCDKHRDTSTGEILSFDVYADDLEGKDCVIIDDICDGGGTFIGLAKELKKKNCGKLYLIVSHGIFSAHVKRLTDVFDHVYCTDSFNYFIYSQRIPENFTCIPLNENIIITNPK